MPIDLAKALRIARAAANISQAEIAKRVGHHESAVSRWESGTRTPSLEQVDAIAKILGIDFDLFVSLGRSDSEISEAQARAFQQWLNKVCRLPDKGQEDGS